MTSQWNTETLLTTARQFQSASVIVAAAELDLIPALSQGPMNARDLARRLTLDERATAILADALAALGLLQKEKVEYRPADGIAPLFDENSPGNVVNMLRHQANCLRSWAQLANVVKQGTHFDRLASVRGYDEDRRSFIEAMEVASHEAAPEGGHLPGIPSLQEAPGYRRRTRDLDPRLPRCQPRTAGHLLRPARSGPHRAPPLRAHGLLERVKLVPGDFYQDESFPKGADMAWISAITHQNSREQNRELYTKVHDALAPEGSIFIRDMVMSDDHVSPTAGAMFAINMLVNTEAGGTFSFAEQSEDLAAAGFEDPDRARGNARNGLGDPGEESLSDPRLIR